jgi:hypothetical protein
MRFVRLFKSDQTLELEPESRRNHNRSAVYFTLHNVEVVTR